MPIPPVQYLASQAYSIGAATGVRATVPVVASQIRAVLSLDHVATRLPSGDQATLRTRHPRPHNDRRVPNEPDVSRMSSSVTSYDKTECRWHDPRSARLAAVSFHRLRARLVQGS